MQSCWQPPQKLFLKFSKAEGESGLLPQVSISWDPVSSESSASVALQSEGKCGTPGKAHMLGKHTLAIFGLNSQTCRCAPETEESRCAWTPPPSHSAQGLGCLGFGFRPGSQSRKLPRSASLALTGVLNLVKAQRVVHKADLKESTSHPKQ